MKKLLCMIFTVVLTISMFAGCGKEQTGEAAADDTKIGTGKTVGIVMVTSQSQWCNDMVAAVSEVVKEEGFEVNVSDS